MNPQSIALVQASWGKMASSTLLAGSLFYIYLFRARPSLEDLFKQDKVSNGVKVMRTIGFIVGKLNDLDTLIPYLQQLGQRHAGYGVQQSHYRLAGSALMDVLRRILGNHFSPELEGAWNNVYAFMEKNMTSDSHHHESPLELL